MRSMPSSDSSEPDLECAGDYEVSLNPLLEYSGQALIQNELGYGNRLVIDDVTLP